MEGAILSSSFSITSGRRMGNLLLAPGSLIRLSELNNLTDTREGYAGPQR